MRDQILQALKELKKHADTNKVPSPSKGICYNCILCMYFIKASDVLGVYKEFNEIFGEIGFVNSTYPIGTEMHWAGEIGKRRYQLLLVIIEYLETKLGKNIV